MGTTTVVDTARPPEVAGLNFHRLAARKAEASSAALPELVEIEAPVIFWAAVIRHEPNLQEYG